MPIGARHPGVGVGPNVGPRGVDPNLPGFGAGFAAAAPGLDLRIIRYDEKVLTAQSSAIEQRMDWQPHEQQGDLILIDRIVVAHDTFDTTVTTIFWSTDNPNFNDSLNKFEFTDLPRDVADENPPIILPASRTIVVTVGFGPGNTANVHFWYRVGRLV